MSDPFELEKSLRGSLKLAGSAAQKAKAAPQPAATWNKVKQAGGGSAMTGMKRTVAGNARATGAIGSNAAKKVPGQLKPLGSRIKSTWDKQGFGTKLAITGVGVGAAAGAGTYAGRKTFGKSEDHDPFEVEKSWKKIEPKLISADRAILHRTLKGKGASPKGKDARNAEYIAGRRDRGYLASSHVKKNDDSFEVSKTQMPGVVRAAATAAKKPARVKAAQDVMAMKGSGRKTLKAMDALRPKK